MENFFGSVLNVEKYFVSENIDDSVEESWSPPR
jgi:hypothetical protein